MITLDELKAFSRYMDHELLSPAVAPVVYWVEELIAAGLVQYDVQYPRLTNDPD